MKKIGILFWLINIVVLVNAEDGSRLWLRYETVPPPLKTELLENISSIYQNSQNQTLIIAASEIQQALFGFTGRQIPVAERANSPSLLLVTANTRMARRLGINSELRNMHQDGYLIKTIPLNNINHTVIASPTPKGVLYGAYAWIRQVQSDNYTTQTPVKSEPHYDLRMLNHWDNLDGTIERGYAGYSLWKWDELPATLSPRYQEYARANASVGINATVLNNVNANPQILSTSYLEKLKALAEVFRPYGIQLFISVNFASPAVLDDLPHSDPFDAQVQQWWKNKAKEIYTLIPDFGGFLVKANSEGQPGPMDYGRTHADGANMLAAALKPYGGLVIWRAFVYDPGEKDRATQAYNEFVPLDGVFAENVIIQVKNGPVDFQPREPFSPIFGAMRETQVMVELQITQEYTGFSNHLVFLGPQNEEVLKSDTWAFGEGSSVARITDGTLISHPVSAIAGVANTGENNNWTGHHFAQANWYAFGRQAWDHTLTSEQIADEWLRATFTWDDEFLLPVKELMLSSHETVVNYMMPLGLHHLFAWGHHYGPEPWTDIPGAREDWLPRYYHNASEYGIGFDRTREGSGAVDQYFIPLNDIFNNVETCPEKHLLWFHHLPWDYTMKSGRSLWDELAYKYQEGVDSVRSFQKTWDRMEPYVDKQRFEHVQSRLRIQARDAVWWRDAIMLYFQTYSKMPIPYELERPVHELQELKKIQLDLKHHN